MIGAKQRLEVRSCFPRWEEKERCKIIYANIRGAVESLLAKNTFWWFRPPHTHSIVVGYFMQPHSNICLIHSELYYVTSFCGNLSNPQQLEYSARLPVVWVRYFFQAKNEIGKRLCRIICGQHNKRTISDWSRKRLQSLLITEAFLSVFFLGETLIVDELISMVY